MKRNTCVIHLGDIHVGHSPETVGQLRKIFEHIEKDYRLESTKVVVIHSGDLVDNTREPKYLEQATLEIGRFVTSMKQKLGGDNFQFLYCVGNHDLGNFFQFQKSLERIESYLKPITDLNNDFYQHKKIMNEKNEIICEKESFQGVVEFGGIRFIVLNSLAQANPATWVLGSLGKKQIQWLDRVLGENEGGKHVIIMHHHPFAKKVVENKKGGECTERFSRHSMKGLIDEDDFKKILKKHKISVNAVLFGHRHEREVLDWSDVFDEIEKDETSSNNPILLCGGFCTKDLMYDVLLFNRKSELIKLENISIT